MAALGELATKPGALPSAATARALFPRQIPALVANPDKTAVVVRALPALSIGIDLLALHKYPCEGAISGLVTEKSSGSALPAPGARVHLYVTDGMQLVARAVTAASGAYVFRALYVAPEAYTVLCLPPKGLTAEYKPLVFNRITPV